MPSDFHISCHLFHRPDDFSAGLLLLSIVQLLEELGYVLLKARQVSDLDKRAVLEHGVSHPGDEALCLLRVAVGVAGEFQDRLRQQRLSV